MTVEIGQKYRDRDKRELSGRRIVEVVGIEGDKAVVKTAISTTRIRIDRLTNPRYFLLQTD